ncbi:hypothetical protein FAM21834_01170 [Lentilactobacillus parabuchneri]|uniref:ABC transporter permease n=1 Tax=Lentilactobacillus parabuchneri TaxID=152331 RepID=A0A1X1FF67_9LACO|nr:hypothetical protein [Lentilactobacillus parabuchneri]APR07308.1 hypothetical protein FAM21731_01114 [Lentilactobacillus parabuchneri]MBW0223041.1 ABC transporter permease [Lentilactobacillus parabuchneri]MBW0245350.1 ABC transporter permease [Lentilactobacillus parabuchneri]MBW0263877.1 ABC transporter permease [Lentilactobacillus parabuchneri]MCT2884561.1 ABC transporter permease [Lentilactobacillus parabuchneri]
MTSFFNLNKTLTRPKIRIANRILLIDVIAIVVALLYEVYQGQLETQTPIAISLLFSIFVGIVAFILFSRNSEHIFVSDSYRLIPTSDTNLFSANLLSSFIAMIYVGLVQLVLYLVTLIPYWGQFGSAFKTTMYFLYQSSNKAHFAMNVTLSIISAIVLAVVALLFFWTSISLIHLTGYTLTNFLPDARQKFFRFVLYIVVVFAFGYIYTVFANRIGDIIEHFHLFEGMSSNLYANLFLASLYLIVFGLLESIGIVYLLKKWVETEN